MEARLFSGMEQGTSSPLSIEVGATHYGHLCKVLLLLGSLYRGPLYGYELYHTIHEYDAMKATSFYAILDRLVASQCVYYEVAPALCAARDKRIYALTHKGYRQFSMLLHALLLTDKALPGGVEIALCFLDHLPEAEGLQLLHARRGLLANLRVLTLAKLAGHSAAPASSRSMNYRLRLLDAELAWIDQMLVDVPAAISTET